VPVICASEKTHLTNISGDQHTRPLYLTIGSIRKDIRWTPEMRTWILIGLIPCPPKGAKNIDKAWHNAVVTVLSQLRHLDITGPGLKWDCADGFQRQCYRCWLPGSGILLNKSCLLKSHMAHARCVKFLKVRQWDMQLFDHLITQETSIFTRSCWRTIILMLRTL